MYTDASEGEGSSHAAPNPPVSSHLPQPDSDGFVDPGPWYPWKADTTWYEPHPTIEDYRLHEKWFPGAPTLATHPDGQSRRRIRDDGKTYPPSMFIEGRPDLEYFGMGVDPPETVFESVGTVDTAQHFQLDELWAGFNQNANDELDELGRPLPFVTVFEDEIVALVEEFLWRRRRARWYGWGSRYPVCILRTGSNGRSRGPPLPLSIPSPVVTSQASRDMIRQPLSRLSR